MDRFFSIIFITVILAGSFQTKAQEGNTTSGKGGYVPRYESLKINSSPAFVLLGIEPENIQRPGSPKQFVAAMQNATTNGKLKPNVAFEFTPFYFSKKNDKDSLRFNPAEYLLAPSKSVFNNINKSLTFSVATSESDTVAFGKLKPGTALGVGLRCLLIEGTRKKGVIADLREWQKAEIKIAFYDALKKRIKDPKISTLPDVIMAFNETRDVFVNQSLKETRFNPFSHSYAKDIIEQIGQNLLMMIEKGQLASKEAVALRFSTQREIYNAVEAGKLASLASYGKLPFAKEGFMLELAAGEALVFQNNQTGSPAHAKAAIWLTPSYRQILVADETTTEMIDFMGVIRFTFNNKAAGIDVADYFDAGTRIQYTRNRASFSLEAVYRRASEVPAGVSKNYTWRFVSSFDYKINELITFKFAFGGNFNANTATYTRPKDMVLLGGLSLGLFNQFKKEQGL